MLKISNKELIEYLVDESVDFPMYVRRILNLANQISQGTRPKVVGKVTELIQDFPGKTYEEWERWYLAGHPNAIKNASDKIENMVIQLKEAINKIDRQMIENWVEDLTLKKTFIGLRFQEAILKKVASSGNKPYHLATAEDESKGIDGFIGDKPVSIKPVTYKTQILPEVITVPVIFYEKTKQGLMIEGEDKI